MPIARQLTALFALLLCPLATELLAGHGHHHYGHRPAYVHHGAPAPGQPAPSRPGGSGVLPAGSVGAYSTGYYYPYSYAPYYAPYASYYAPYYAPLAVTTAPAYVIETRQPPAADQPGVLPASAASIEGKLDTLTDLVRDIKESNRQIQALLEQIRDRSASQPAEVTPNIFKP
jgi:hypothetical protein